MNNPLDQLEKEIITCSECPRLVAWREQVAREKRRAYRTQNYWGKPVPGFGDPMAQVLVVGLAPGAHGSNRTGRMFTGDTSGEFLYRALHLAGFASQPESSHREDGLTLKNIFISALCRCVPPQNRPLPMEIAACSHFLLDEMRLLPVQGIVALGKMAFDEVIRLTGQREIPTESPIQFAHGYFLPAREEKPWILASYHPSRQNTQTGRLTFGMFQMIWTVARDHLKVTNATSD